MNLFALAGLSCSISCLVLSVIAFIFGKVKIHRVLAFFNVAVTIWSYGLFIVGIATNEKTALFGWKFAHIGGMFVSILFFHMVCLFCEIKRKPLLIFGYAQAIIFNWVSWIPDRLITKTRYAYGLYYNDTTILFALAALSYLILVVASFYELVVFLKKTKGTKRLQAIYIILSFSIGFIGGTSTFLPEFRIDLFYPAGGFGVALYALIGTYAVLRYRLLDIKVAVTRAGIFAIVYFPVVFIPFWIAPKFIHSNLWWIPTILMGILATLGVFIYSELRKRAEAVLLREDLKKYNTLENFSRALGITRDLELDRLTRLIIYRLVKVMNISYGAIYLLDEEDKFVLKANRSFKGVEPSIHDLGADDDLIKFIKFWRKGFMYEDLQKIMEQQKTTNNKNSKKQCNADLSKALTQMERLKAKLLIPHFLKDELIGFLVLGEKVSSRAYSEADIEVLTTLSRSAGLAITNAISMIKLRDREREFAEAARIIEIGNYASGTEHQLGNVLNSIVWGLFGVKTDKTIIDLLLQSPEALSAFNKKLDAIIIDAKDGGAIIKEIRDYSQQGASKEYKLTSLKEVLDKTLRMLLIHINKFQNIDIPIDIAADVPDIMGSPVGLQQVFINIFNNGYDSIQEMKSYINSHPELGITDYKGRIEVRIRRVKGKVEIHIIDNGKGMTAEVAKKLFGAHFTTKGSLEKRKEMNLNGGTGIGLFVMRRIIFDHSGTIALFRTEPLKGADFIIQLPVPKQ